mmetsp:Transcript_23094/g.33827  ORF Transcript_23094/g.33827 Transcript_23094/m.33827 type:complete len:371 (+) Transcript_23094:142-1254(+)
MNIQPFSALDDILIADVDDSKVGDEEQLDYEDDFENESRLIVSFLPDDNDCSVPTFHDASMKAPNDIVNENIGYSVDMKSSSNSPGELCDKDLTPRHHIAAKEETLESSLPKTRIRSDDVARTIRQPTLPRYGVKSTYTVFSRVKSVPVDVISRIRPLEGKRNAAAHRSSNRGNRVLRTDSTTLNDEVIHTLHRARELADKLEIIKNYQHASVKNVSRRAVVVPNIEFGQLSNFVSSSAHSRPSVASDKQDMDFMDTASYTAVEKNTCTQLTEHQLGQVNSNERARSNTFNEVSSTCGVIYDSEMMSLAQTTFANFLDDVVEISQSRAAKCTSAEETSMHRILSNRIRLIFTEPYFMESILREMVTSASR